MTAWPHAASLASGFAFGLVHGIWGAFRGSVTAAIGATVATGVLGVAPAVVFIASHRVLAPCIVSHLLINALAEPGLVLAAVRGEMGSPGRRRADAHSDTKMAISRSGRAKHEGHRIVRVVRFALGGCRLKLAPMARRWSARCSPMVQRRWPGRSKSANIEEVSRRARCSRPCASTRRGPRIRGRNGRRARRSAPGCRTSTPRPWKIDSKSTFVTPLGSVLPVARNGESALGGRSTSCES